MIKVLREALVVSNVHRVLGIVNGTTNFVLTEMERGASYEDALAEAQRLGFAEADPTEDVSGKDAAAKMAILATVAFGSRVTLDDVSWVGLERVEPGGRRRGAEMGMVVRLIGAATLVGERWDVRVGPALVDRRHPLAAVEGAFNAVMLQGDAIREITLEGPGAGGIETASAVVADMVTIVGTTGTGFLQNDACWRSCERLPEGEFTSPFYVRVELVDRPGALALVAARLAAHGVSVARLVQRPGRRQRDAARRHARGARGQLRAALDDIDALEETRGGRLGPAGGLRPRRCGARVGLTVSLGEGNTPLLPAPRLSERLGCEVWLKWEGANPTGSIKDRGMALAVSRAVERGAPGVVVRLDRQHRRLGGRVRGAGRAARDRAAARGAVARGKIAQAIVAGAEIRHSRHLRGRPPRGAPARRGGRAR